MALLITTANTVTIVRPADGKAFSLKELKGFVGGFIELTYTINAEIRDRSGKSVVIPPDSVMYINEDGISLGLPFNKIATLLYVNGQADPIIGDVIVLEAGEEL